MKRGRIMRKLTPMQIETLKCFYYGEAHIVKKQQRLKRGNFVLMWDLYDSDGVRLTDRAQSLFKRKLLKWGGMGDRTVFCTDAGIKEMEAIDA